MIFSKARMNELEDKKELTENEQTELWMLRLCEEEMTYGPADDEIENI